MSLSNYPLGFGSDRDWDHVAGPLREEDAGDCPECDEGGLIREIWRSGDPTICCTWCDYERVEEEEYVG